MPDITNNNILNEDTIICSGLPGLSIQGNIPSGGDSPQYKYVWQSRPDGSTLLDFSRSLNLLISLIRRVVLNNGTWIRRTVYSGTGDACQSISDSILISTLPAITGNAISSTQTVCEGIMPADLTGSTPTSGGEGPGSYSWQWQKKAAGEANFTDIISGGNQKDYTFSQALSDTTQFRRISLSGPTTYNTCSDTSAIITISVPPAIANNLVAGPADRETCVGTVPGLLDGSNNLTGGNGTYIYLWEQSPDGLLWSDALGPNDEADYQPGALNIPMQYRRIISSASVCTDTAGIVSIDTLTRPVLTLLTANKDSVCHLEKNFALQINIDKGVPDYTVWYSNGTGNGNMEIKNLGQSDQIPVDNFPQQRLSFNFRIDTLTDSKGCHARDENLIQFTAHSELFPDAEPKILLDDSTAVCGSELQISADPDLGLNYFWTVSNSEISLDNSQAKQTYARVSGNFDAQSAYLKFYASSPGCQSIAGYKPSSDSVKIAFFEQPDPVKLDEESTVIFITDEYTVKYDRPSAGQISWSVQEGSGKFSDITTDSTMIYDIPENQNVYRMTVSNGSCEIRQADLSIERKKVNVYDGISPLNPDGINDFLVAEGLDVEDVSFNFQIFSTSGLLVREITGKDIDQLGFRRGLPNNGLEIWDGKGNSKNSFVPAGVYYYVLEITYKGQTYSPDRNYVIVK